jgi:hypothetical protein
MNWEPEEKVGGEKKKKREREKKKKKNKPRTYGKN